MEISGTHHRNAKLVRSWFGILQLEKAAFVFVNVMDIFMTMLLLQTGSFYESNPVANSVINGWGMNGMVLFKLTIVIGVLLIANAIAWKRIKTARGLLFVGTLMVGAVVAYSMNLLLTFNGW